MIYNVADGASAGRRHQSLPPRPRRPLPLISIHLSMIPQPSSLLTYVLLQGPPCAALVPLRAPVSLSAAAVIIVQCDLLLYSRRIRPRLIYSILQANALVAQRPPPCASACHADMSDVSSGDEYSLARPRVVPVLIDSDLFNSGPSIC